MQIGIKAIGTAVPPFKHAQSRVAELMADTLNLSPAKRRMLDSLYKATQIEYRYSVIDDYDKRPEQFSFFPNKPGALNPTTAERMAIYKAEALGLALRALEDCLLQMEDFDIREVTHLITVSCTGMYAPGIDIDLMQAINLSSQTKRYAINFMGCYAAFNALDLAYSICKAEPHAKVLVISVELCTLHFQLSNNMDNIVANALFADGAAAVLIGGSAPSKKSLNFIGFYSELLPQTQNEMAWHITDYGFDIVLSAYVPELIKQGIPLFGKRFLQQHSLDWPAVNLYAIHPGGAKILSACEEALSITKHDNRYAYEVLRNFGNMSSATILFVLKNLINDISADEQNKTVLSCAFGPGLTIHAMLLKVQHV